MPDFNQVLNEDNNQALQSVTQPGVVQSPFTEETNLLEEQAAATSQPLSNGRIFKESVKNMFEDTSIRAIQRIGDINQARKDEEDNELLSPDQANEMYAQYGVHFNNSIRRKEASVIAAQKMKEAATRQRLSRSEGTFASGAASFMGSFVGSLADPINIATMFIPVSKIIPALKGLEATGMMGRTLVRAADGVIMNSFVEPLPLVAAGMDQRDYTMADSLFNLAAGGAFNATMGAIIDGVRGLGAGDQFNSNLASAIELGNNRSLNNFIDFQKRKAAVTNMTFDDLVGLSEAHVDINKVGNNYVVKLKESGPLARLSGTAKDVGEAIQDLRKQIGALFDNDSIYKGYRIDDAIEAFAKAVDQAGFANSKAFSKWLSNTQMKAYKKGISFEDYIAGRTNNFSDFTKILKNMQTSSRMQNMFGELTGDAFDDAVENVAEAFDTMIMLKEAFESNARKGVTFEDYRAILNERNFNRVDILARNDELTQLLSEQRRELDELKNQLVINKLNTTNENLLSKKAELESSISVSQRELDDLIRSNDIETWKAEADNIELLNQMRERLDADPRTFEDVKRFVERQDSDTENHSWDTSDSILDDMTFAEEPFADEARMAKLEEETTMYSENLQDIAKEFDAAERAFWDLDEKGRTSEMAKADEEIANMRELQKDADAYAACRRGELI